MRLKRAIDVIVSAVGLLILSPLIITIAIVVRYRLGKPVLFRQMRAGYHGQTFEIVKFRTMKDSRDQNGNLLPDNQRIPTLGRFLRSTSLDELPELLNVLRGEMSLVGPRPLLPQYLPLYDQQQRRRHDVLPGITGWAQINGRNSISWQQKFILDLWYVDNYSIWLDLKIIFITIWKVLRMSHINQQGQATVKPFTGNG